MIQFLMHLDGVPLTSPSVSLIWSIIPLLVLISFCGIILTLSVVLQSIPATTYDIPQTLSGAPPFLPISDYGIPSLGGTNFIYVTPECGFSAYQNYYFSSCFWYYYVL